jgi:hypothetical protein
MGPRYLAVGALAGYAASRTMDHATTWFYGRQTDASKEREEELAPGGTLVQLGKQLGSAAGRELDDRQAGKAGLAVHRTMGMLYGVGAAALVRRGVPPLKAGLAVGAAAWLIIDEGTAAPQFTDYPAESHLRGLVGHATLGLAVGLLLRVVRLPAGSL